MELRNATLKDWSFLLSLRNDEETRRNSKNNETIHPEEHLSWLKKVLQDPNVHLFIAVQDHNMVGTARANFEPSTGVYELSWTISPESRGKGFGKQMIKALAEKFGSKIRAEIKNGNLSSIRLAESVGMRLVMQKDDILYFSK